jgi:hypothetical protein
MAISPTNLTPLSVAALVVAGGLALAAGQYGPGASDTEINDALQRSGLSLRHDR